MVPVGEAHVKRQVHPDYALMSSRLTRQRNHFCGLPYVAAGNQKIAARK